MGIRPLPLIIFLSPCTDVALFCDGANGLTVGTRVVVHVHVLVTIAEGEVARDVVAVVVAARRRTPIDTAAAITVER